LFRIIAESGIAAGVRRIEAAGGAPALAYMRQAETELRAVARTLKASRKDVAQKVRALVESQRDLQRELDQLKAQRAASQGADLADQVRRVKDVSVLAAQVSQPDGKAMLATLDALKSKLGSAVIVLAGVEAGAVTLIAGVTKDLTNRVKAGDVIKALAPMVGAKGGGRPDMARAGGGDRPEAVPELLAAVFDWVAERL
jgi:alanyl-tRNA synthetase